MSKPTDPEKSMTITPRRKYRLGLDVGTNSLGWFVLWLSEQSEPTSLGPGGVRIFPDGRDPQSKTSNAVDRRTARGQRRRRDRYLHRRKDLMEELVKHGLMPTEIPERKLLEALDPYELRAKALDGAISLHHFGRAIFHLNQRRGFKSNRKSDKPDDDKGAIKEAASKLRTAMKETGVRTLGEFLWHRHKPDPAQPDRARLIAEELSRVGKSNLHGNARKKAVAKIKHRLGLIGEVTQTTVGIRARNTGTAVKASYDLYPTRELYEAEFDEMWRVQSELHPELTDDKKLSIHNAIFYQRPLVSPPVGKCSLDPAQTNDDIEGFRCSWAHPLAQRFRIWQEVRNLAIAETGKSSRMLNKDEGDKVALALFQNGKVSFDKLRSLLKLPEAARFNLESERRSELIGDETAAKLSQKALFGKTWRGYGVDRQIEIIEKLLDEEDEAALVAWLEGSCGLSADVATKVAGAILPDGHSRCGLRAIRALVPHMEAGKTKTEAEKAAGYADPSRPTGENLDRLPYYGEWLKDAVVGSGDHSDDKEKRWGKFPNPTVHIGLGQLRRVVNSLVKDLGAPDEVVVELARELKLSKKEKVLIEKDQAANERRNAERRKLLIENGQPDNSRNLMKMRLWEELNPRDPLDRRCPFSGEQIGIARLLTEEIEFEHLIPFSVSLDDSAANKVVCTRFANRAKGKNIPFDAFGKNPTIEGHRYEWSGISARADALPKNKRWRFQPDALQRFQAQGGFLARQLNETRWLASLAKDYLTAVTDPNKVWVIPGQLTAMIRGKWGLNSLLPDHNFTDAKNRADHRHHAIDALVAGLTDRGLLNKMSRAYDEERDRVEIPLPWNTLRDDLKVSLDKMIVSHKPDHGPQGKLHKETAYGFVRNPSSEGGNLTYRKPLVALTDKEILRIRDPSVRTLVSEHVANAKANGTKLADALAMFAKVGGDGESGIARVKHGLRRVRLIKTENESQLVVVKDSSAERYKAYSAGDNFCVDIFENERGKWCGEAVTKFQANQPNFSPNWVESKLPAKLVMRLHKGDLVRLSYDGRTRIMVVRQLDAPNDRVLLVEHNEAGNLDRRDGNDLDPFEWLRAAYSKLKIMNAERVRVDALGRVWRVRPEEVARSLQRKT